MKVLGFIISAFILIFSLSGCSLYPHQAWLEDDSDKRIAEKTLNDIVSALENKDNTALKSMFSEKAKADAVNLDKGIKDIIQFYQGKMISKEGSPSSEENIDGSDKKLTITGIYDIKTDKETYYCCFSYISNTADKSEDGLYNLQILKQSDKADRAYWCTQDIKYTGILQSNELKSINYLTGTVKYLCSHSSKDIKSLFSTNAMSSATKIDENINKSFNIVQGFMATSKEISSSVKTEGDTTITTGYYEVTTKNLQTDEYVGTYLVYFVHKRNEVDENEDGIYTLQIVEKVDSNTQFSTEDIAGVYCPDV